MRYNIIGWYGQNNCGDEAFKLAFPQILKTDNIQFSEFEDPNCINILGGGDVIKPYYLDRIKGPFYIIGAGLGYESEIILLRNKQVIKAFFRNKKDVLLAKIAGINAEYTPDIVFSLPKPKKIGSFKKVVVVTLNGAIEPHPEMDSAERAYSEYLKWEIAKCLVFLKDDYDIVFLPFSEARFNYDLNIHRDVYGRMATTKQLKSLPQPLSPNDTINVIANADLVITMKFHGVIFSTLAGTPFVNIGLSRKSHLFCKEHGLERLSVDPYSLTYDRFVDAIRCAEKYSSELLLAIAEEKRNILLGTKFI